MSTRIATGRAAADEFDELLAQARAGCAASRGQLLQAFRRFLLLAASRTLESTLRVKAGASDVVQDVFVSAHRDFESFRGNTPSELSSWLQTILHSRMQTLVRRYKRAQRREVRREVSIDQLSEPWGGGSLANHDDPGAAAALADEVDRLRFALSALRPAYQNILELRSWQRMPFPEIARLMGKSPAAVEKLWVRACLALKSELGDQLNPR